jgi:hypothetical protein
MTLRIFNVIIGTESSFVIFPACPHDGTNHKNSVRIHELDRSVLQLELCNHSGCKRCSFVAFSANYADMPLLRKKMPPI